MENVAQNQIDITQTDPVLCEECEGSIFEQVLHLRKASGFVTGTGKTSYLPIPVFACKACGHINSEFQPREGKRLE